MIWSAQFLWLSHSSTPQTARIYYSKLTVYLFNLLLIFFSFWFYSCTTILNSLRWVWLIVFISYYCYLTFDFNYWFSLNLCYSYWVNCSIRLSSASSYCFWAFSCYICAFKKLPISTSCKARLFFSSFSATNWFCKNTITSWILD